MRPSLPARLVRQFHEYFNLPIGDTSRTTNTLRARVIREEANEAAEAIENYDTEPTRENLAKVAHELADAVFAVYGSALTYGIDLDQAVRIVHEANMTRQGADSTGKVVKGPDYRPPDLDAALPAKICACYDCVPEVR